MVKARIYEVIMDILTNKQYKQYNKISRYNNFPFYYNTLDKKYEYSTTAHLDDSTPYQLYSSNTGDTWDSIALNFYNNPTYFWVLCDFNRIQDPYSFIKPGTSIKIPVFSSIMYKM